MTAHLPTIPPYLRLLDELLSRTASQSGFASARVLVEDGPVVCSSPFHSADPEPPDYGCLRANRSCAER